MVAGLYAPGRFCQKNFSIISVITGNYSDQTPNNGFCRGLGIADYGKTCQLLVQWGFTVFNPIFQRLINKALKSS